MFPYLRSIRYFREDYEEVLYLNLYENEINDNLDRMDSLTESVETLISYRYKGGIGDAEKRSWIYSMREMNCHALMKVNTDVKIAFEYLYDYRINNPDNVFNDEDGLVGYTKRIDTILGGKNANDDKILLAFELKCWSINKLYVVRWNNKRIINEVEFNNSLVNNINDINEDTFDTLRIAYRNIDGDYVVCDSPFKQIKQYCDSINMENSKVREGDIQIFPFVWLYNYSNSRYRNENERCVDAVIQKWSEEYDDIYFYNKLSNNNKTNDLNAKIKSLLNKEGEYINDVFSEFKKGFSNYELCKEINNIYNFEELFVESDNNDNNIDIRDDLGIRLRGDQYNCLNKIIKQLDKIKNDENNNVEQSIIRVSGGVGSGKSLLAVLLYKYCIEQLGYTDGKACFVSPQGAELLAFKNKIKDEDIKKYKEKKEYELYALYNYMMRYGKFKRTYNKNKKCKITIVDEAHNLIKSKTGVDQYDYIKDNSEVVILFYDNRQASGRFRSFEESPNYNLISHFRCNQDEGYLDFVDDVLNNKTDKKLEYYGVDFEVRLIKKMESYIKDKNTDNRLVLTCHKDERYKYATPGVIDEDKTLLNCGLERNTSYKDGSSIVFVDSKKVYGTYYDIRGLEVLNEIVYLKRDVIWFDNKHNKVKVCGKKEGKDIIKQRLEILLTRALQSCYIYCEDKALRDYLNETRGIPFVE